MDRTSDVIYFSDNLYKEDEVHTLLVKVVHHLKGNIIMPTHSSYKNFDSALYLLHSDIYARPFQKW